MSRSHRRRDRMPIARDVHVPPYQTLSDFKYAFMLNVTATSGTVAHGQQRGNRGERKGKPYANYNGAALKAKAEANMRRVAVAVVRAGHEGWAVSRFLAVVPVLIHHGFDHGKKLRAVRLHDTGMPYGCRAHDVPRRWKAFQQGLSRRLERQDDPVEIAAWVEYEIRFGIHPLGDGCGRLATATAAWIMLRGGRRIPTYAQLDRSAFHEALRSGPEQFSAFYRANCVRRVEETPPFDRATAEKVVA